MREIRECMCVCVCVCTPYLIFPIKGYIIEHLDEWTITNMYLFTVLTLLPRFLSDLMCIQVVFDLTMSSILIQAPWHQQKVK